MPQIRLILIATIMFCSFATMGCAKGVRNCNAANLNRYQCNSTNGKLMQCAVYKGNYGFMEMTSPSCAQETCKCNAGEKKESFTSLTCDEDGVSYKCVKGCRCAKQQDSSHGK